jgi:hypothetical protein
MTTARTTAGCGGDVVAWEWEWSLTLGFSATAPMTGPDALMGKSVLASFETSPRVSL